ncbi:MAG: hypothetical protein HYZ28_29125 [Myxococcales bacterium]|nr:hypothetical protein [Myxococcales bacterium]
MSLSVALSQTQRRYLWAAAGLGVLAFGGGLLSSPARAFTSLLVAAFLFTSLSLGALVFLALMYLSNAGWSAALKRVPEALSSYLPYGGLSLLLVLPGLGLLYHWLHPGEDALLQAKVPYLNLPFFVARMVGFLLVWIGFAWALRRQSRAQDADGSPTHTRRSVATSAAFLVVFAITFSLASVDWLMSLEPHWYSTIFGLYQIGGAMLGGVCAITVAAVLLRRAGHLPIGEAHLHDLGKLLFGFSTLWAYLWLSQYLLVWYANIPEETTHYLARTEGGWGFLFYLNVALGWAVPFTMLLPRPAKRSETNLLWACGFLLAGRWLDIYLMAGPAAAPEHLGIGLLELGVTAGLAAVFVLVVARALGSAPMVPKGDPYLVESLHHH